jgi:hypothetical protein
MHLLNSNVTNSIILRHLSVTSMAIVSIELETYRCPKGYRIVRAAEIARANGVDPHTYPDEDWIVPNGSERASFRPLDKNDMVCVAFAGVRTPERLLEFITLYGSLTGSSPQWGDSIPGCLGTSRRFYDLLSCKEKGPKKLASVFNSQRREIEARSYREAGEPLAPDHDFGVLSLLLGTVDLVADPVRGVHLRVKTDALIGALWWQLVQKLSGGTSIRTCRHCSALFETGPGTGKHIDATFCCDAHKVKYFSAARTHSSIAKRAKR